MKIKKNKNAQAMAYLRSKSLTPERRSEIASNAGKTRWLKAKKEKKEGKSLSTVKLA